MNILLLNAFICTKTKNEKKLHAIDNIIIPANIISIGKYTVYIIARNTPRRDEYPKSIIFI